MNEIYEFRYFTRDPFFLTLSIHNVPHSAIMCKSIHLRCHNDCDGNLAKSSHCSIRFVWHFLHL